MKIAIVTPHSVPFALGGAENLWWGLQQHFQDNTPHSCDIIALVAAENSFWDLVDAYKTYSELDLSGYDCVISGKYPAWMVKHPNHICYMLHRLRGLYDTYHEGPHDLQALEAPAIRSLVKWMDEAAADGQPAHDEQIDELFQRLKVLREAGLPPESFAFPGPLIRKIVHFLDNAALSPRRITRYAAIAGTVSKRKGYFPDDAIVDVLYPPPHRNDYREGESRYLFTNSRLDRPKRVDLIIEAMKHVKEDIPLLIGGSGPDEARLKELAAADKRIRFLGFVPDDEMPALYADALAVPFVPYDEDYGLVTIEAMRSAKPVLTVTDAGGPCEFVRNGETGFVTATSPEAFGEAIGRLVREPQLARDMGFKAKALVEPITWQNAADGLLSAAATTQRAKVRPKLTVATTFRVFPPMNGGQARVFHLYKNLAEIFDIDIVSLGSSVDSRSEKEIAPGLMEICIPKSDAHAETEHLISDLLEHIPIGDIAAHSLVALSDDYLEALELSAMTSEAVIACHPYLVTAIRKTAPDKPLWFEAQDVEFTLKSQFLAKTPHAAVLLDEVRSAERDCWLSASRVFACAHRDLEELAGIYGRTRAHIYEVPNGVALDEIPYTPLATRRRLQKLAGLEGKQTVLFMGSWHGPNLRAVEDILAAAPRAPKTRFIVIGSVGLPFKDRKLPANVELLGQVEAQARNDLLAVADAALNPMHSGSGTNLKMLDYFAAGIPVISTAFGARGLLSKPDEHYIPGEDLVDGLNALSALDEASLGAMIVASRQLAEEQYSWKVIAERFAVELAATGFDPGVSLEPEDQ